MDLPTVWLVKSLAVMEKSIKFASYDNPHSHLTNCSQQQAITRAGQPEEQRDKLQMKHA